VSAPLFEIRDLAVDYGSIRGVHKVDLTVGEGEIVALIGANGAGKSTTLKAASGLLRPARGSITYNGTPLHAKAPQNIVRAGVVQVPEGRAILTTMTVAENLLLGAWTRADPAGVAKDLAEMTGRFPILGERLHSSAGHLSGGEQQMLAIARALMARPRLLLLDEPSMGLAPLIVKYIFEILTEINRAGTSILLVEQNARQALKIADRGYVLETGRTVLTGTGGELMSDAKVIGAYLGG